MCFGLKADINFRNVDTPAFSLTKVKVGLILVALQRYLAGEPTDVGGIMRRVCGERGSQEQTAYSCKAIRGLRPEWRDASELSWFNLANFKLSQVLAFIPSRVGIVFEWVVSLHGCFFIASSRVAQTVPSWAGLCPMCTGRRAEASALGRSVDFSKNTPAKTDKTPIACLFAATSAAICALGLPKKTATWASVPANTAASLIHACVAKTKAFLALDHEE